MKQLRILLSCLLLAALLAGCGAKETTVDTDLRTLMEKIYEFKTPPFGVMEATELDLSDAPSVNYYLGLENGDSLSETCYSESMISAQAYSLVLARVKDATAVRSVVEAMESGIDTRKWICVEADDLRVVACGDVVMLAMIDSSYAGDLTADDLVAGFREACGRPLDIE